MSAATPTAAALNPAANKILVASIRHNIGLEMNAAVFQGRERKKSEQAVKQCDDVEKLHKWLKNIRAERAKREQALKDQRDAANA